MRALNSETSYLNIRVFQSTTPNLAEIITEKGLGCEYYIITVRFVVEIGKGRNEECNYFIYINSEDRLERHSS